MTMHRATVLARSLNLRPEPNTSKPPIESLSRNQQLLVLDTRGDWLQVQRGTTIGFVAKRFVRVEDKSDNPLWVDASHHNGNPNWAQLADDRRFFGAMLKATEDTQYRFANTWFKEHWPAVRQAGGARYGTSWFRAAYHYLIFGSSGREQADYFLQVVEAAGGFGEGDLPAVVDVELGREGGPNREASPQQVVDCTRAFAERIVEQTGREPILYGRGAMRDLGIRDRMGCRYLWNPSYTSEMRPTSRIGWPEHLVAFWQYTNGKVPAAAEPRTAPGLGGCDISRFRLGDEMALAKLCAERSDAEPPSLPLMSTQALQERLIELGYNPGDNDGDAGGMTQTALNLFRRDHGISTTGPLDQETQAALQESNGRPAQVAPRAVGSDALEQTRRFVGHPDLVEEARFRPMLRTLADYYERVHGDEAVAFPELLARTAEMFLEVGVHEDRGQNRGDWVDFLRGVGGGVPDDPSAWCAYFASACLRITTFCGEEKPPVAISGRAAELYITAPESAKIPRENLSPGDAAVRGSVFVRGRLNDKVERRQRILRGIRTRAHTGIVVGWDGGNLLCIAGNSSGSGHARASSSGSVATEIIGPDGKPVAKLAWERLAGVVHYA